MRPRASHALRCTLVGMLSVLASEGTATGQECTLEPVTTLGVVVSGGSTYQGQPASYAFSSPGSYYTGVSSASTFIGRDFGAGVVKSVRRMEFYGTVSYTFYGKVQYSDDGTTFTDTGVTVNIGPNDATWRSYDIPNLGVHRFWVVRDLQDDQFLQIDEIRIHACIVAGNGPPVVTDPSNQQTPEGAAVSVEALF